MAEKAARKGAASDGTVSCREITGINCDYVAGADGNTAATAGFHVDQVMSLLGMHMAQKHQESLGLEERNAIRAQFS